MREVYNFPTEYTTKTSISHSSLDPHFSGKGLLSALKPLESKGQLCFNLRCPGQCRGGPPGRIDGEDQAPFCTTSCSALQAVAAISLCAARSQRET